MSRLDKKGKEPLFPHEGACCGRGYSSDVLSIEPQATPFGHAVSPPAQVALCTLMFLVEWEVLEMMTWLLSWLLLKQGILLQQAQHLICRIRLHVPGRPLLTT